jgi:hypothetical protein
MIRTIRARRGGLRRISRSCRSYCGRIDQKEGHQLGGPPTPTQQTLTQPARGAGICLFIIHLAHLL